MRGMSLKTEALTVPKEPGKAQLQQFLTTKVHTQ